MKKLYRLLLLIILLLTLTGCRGQSDEEIKKVVERIENVAGKTDEQKYMDLYVTGLLWENKDIKTAESYYLAAVKYKKSAYADIGRMYYRKVSKKKGKEKYMEGWEKGDSESANELGIIYDRYEKKPDEAERWWILAGEAGNAGAQYSLGLMYEKQGELSKTLYWYKRSAEQGNSKAQNNLGAFYDSRNLVSEAKYWYEIAANQGVVESQFNLGVLYEEKIKKIELAKYWYKKSAEQGDVESQERLKKIIEREKYEK